MAESKRDYYEVLGVPKNADEAAFPDRILRVGSHYHICRIRNFHTFFRAAEAAADLDYFHVDNRQSCLPLRSHSRAPERRCPNNFPAGRCPGSPFGRHCFGHTYDFLPFSLSIFVLSELFSRVNSENVADLQYADHLVDAFCARALQVRLQCLEQGAAPVFLRFHRHRHFRRRNRFRIRT